MGRIFVIAPNGEMCSAIYAGNGNLQTYSHKRRQWESFPRCFCKDIIDEDDLSKEWDEVKEKYPNTSKEEFELKQKEFQEV